MMLCVICNEDYPKLTRTSLEEFESTMLQNVWLGRVINACEIWNAEKREVNLIEHGDHELPVLLTSGGRDAATPPKYGSEVLNMFPNRKHLVVEEAGHSFDRMLGCVEKIINDLVIPGNTSQLKTNGTNKSKYPEFKLN